MSRCPYCDKNLTGLGCFQYFDHVSSCEARPPDPEFGSDEWFKGLHKMLNERPKPREYVLTPELMEHWGKAIREYLDIKFEDFEMGKKAERVHAKCLNAKKFKMAAKIARKYRIRNVNHDFLTASSMALLAQQKERKSKYHR